MKISRTKTPTEPFNPTERLGWVALGSIAVVAFLGKCYETPLPPDDSGLYAITSMNMTSRGVLPILPVPGLRGATDGGIGGWNEHPFTFLFANGWILRLLGPAAWSARLLPGLLGAGT